MAPEAPPTPVANQRSGGDCGSAGEALDRAAAASAAGTSRPADGDSGSAIDASGTGGGR